MLSVDFFKCMFLIYIKRLHTCRENYCPNSMYAAVFLGFGMDAWLPVALGEGCRFFVRSCSCTGKPFTE